MITQKWQPYHSGSGRKVFGKDFPEYSVSLDDESILVIDKGTTFMEFWALTYEPEWPNKVKGEMYLGKTTPIVDFITFLGRHNLDKYALEIFKKFSEIGGFNG